ncbi:MAG: cell wall-binding repeat-containing protein [Frankiales bacterium]|nr:cell wall-binding repeat-containing protein [Frankiales bacterium]
MVGTGLHLWTEGATSTDKVAEYVATTTKLASVGEPVLEYTNTSATGAPGTQLVVDFDADGSVDGILVSEPAFYGNDWWVGGSSKQFVKDGAPSHSGGYGSSNHGTLDQWRGAFPTAKVLAFGFSLGSGVKGDGVLDAIDFAGDRYTFAAKGSGEQCKDGGWSTSTSPVFHNQGECVSSFATTK